MKPSNTDYDSFIEDVLKANPKADIILIKRAFDFARKCHEGQKRESGEEYFVHPLETARVLIDLSADSATIASALLHDCSEDAHITIEQIKKEFGDEVASLVEGVTKIQGVQFGSKEEYTTENLRKVLLATAKDIRVMMIKLADRLHNMRTIKYFREDKQKRIAKETLEIYAPIAHKLGIRSMKGELEDLSLKVLDPESYQLLRKKIAEKREEREKRTKEFISIIKQKLQERGINAELEGRAKYFYSIYEKMKKEGKEFNEIYDLIAIRIITSTVPECYAALGIVHELWKPIPGKFKDFISVPKENGYQSLHTSVVGSHGKILEIQIRTKDMHNIAEYGIAAHWRYKGTERDKHFDRRISWIKQLLDWKQDSKTPSEFIETLKVDLFENEIVVFTPKGDPISLPENATPIDFAYEVHSNIGDHCSKALVNNKIVSLEYPLKSGDIVEIITQKNAKPSRGWLSFVKTSKARGKIRAALGIKTPEIEKKAEDETGADLVEVTEMLGKKVPARLSKCCTPRYGDPIIAFRTSDGKVAVHKKDCIHLETFDKSKSVVARWKEREESKTLSLRLTVLDRVGLLAEVLNMIAMEKINIHSIYTRSKKNRIVITLKLDLPPEADMKNLVAKIKAIKDVLDIKVITGFFSSMIWRP
ncbi:(p)ppGpp synthetase [Candidatus Woesearchaeota archaeon CG10_big_fil_rev_8_21_14_0_10_44_13]|nr:MAG: (p)ppGpp synthetase [Candidatus Woesearchaeota archaeon CG10_big_fil_rev_8_21_14_0_10_44_13]